MQWVRDAGARARVVRAAVEALEGRQLLCGSHGDGLLSVTPLAAPFDPVASTAVAPAAATTGGAKHPLSSLPILNSRPGAPAKLFLDFNGYNTSSWGSYSPGRTPALDQDGDSSTFNDAELATIREAFERVAEDFAPFNLNVTTADPGTYADRSALRVVVGGSSRWYGSTVSGLGFVNAFTNPQPNTVFVFVNSNPTYLADIISHESGHGFGLNHQEIYNSSGVMTDAYANGDSTSKPLMGGGGGRSVWWRGASGSAGNTQDDIAVISRSTNGFGLRRDDHGNSQSSATALGSSGVATGVIESSTDSDWFRFSGSGNVVITVDPAARRANLDARIELRNAAGTTIRSAHTSSLGEKMTTTISSGTYGVRVRSAGRVGDIGTYTLRVSAGATTATTAPTVTAQMPFTASPASISTSKITTIQAESFDKGDQGIAYHDTTSRNDGGAYRTSEGVDIKTTSDSGGGYRISDARVGEWLEYTVDVTQAGQYQADFRVSNSQSGGRFHLEVDGVDVTGSLTVPNTGSFHTLRTVSRSGIWLSAGRHVLRLSMDAAPSNDSIGGFNWLRFSPAAVASTASTAPGSQVKLTTSTAAYVRDGTTAGANYGSSSSLNVKKSSSSSRESYLKFDLSSVDHISSGRLRLWGDLSSTLAGGVQVGVYASSNTSWSEKSLTWNNRPASDATALATATITGTSSKWHEWDLTSFLRAQKAAGKTQVTLVLKATAGSSPYTVFNSDDASSNKPELLIS